jgi:hypothetical protein
LTTAKDLQLFSSPADLPQPIMPPATIVVWPYQSLDYIPEVLAPPVLISTSSSDLVYGELDESSFHLFERFHAEEAGQLDGDPLAEFAGGLTLVQADVTELADDRLQVDVYWQSAAALDEELVVFVHVMGPGGLLGQHDVPPAEGRWLESWWRAGQLLQDRHIIELDEPYDAARHQILIGLYRASTGERLLVSSAAGGETAGTAWILGYEQ